MKEKLKGKAKEIILFILCVVLIGVITNMYNFFMIGWNLKTKDAYVVCEKCEEWYKIDRIEDNFVYIYECESPEDYS